MIFASYFGRKSGMRESSKPENKEKMPKIPRLLESSLGGKTYPGLTIYAAAAYAFYRIIMSTIHIWKANKQKSPLLMTIRKIGYMDACVSILILQTAMFASFAQGKEAFTKIMNGITGVAVSLMALGIGIQGICSAEKMKIK